MFNHKLTVMWRWFVSWGRCVVSRGFVDWFVGIITWSSFICYFNNVARVAISGVVFDNLSTAIWKDYAVFTISRVTVTGFVGTKVNSSIFVSYSIFVLVFCWNISVGWLTVRRCGFVRWGWLVDWCGLVDWGWVVNWGWFVGWSRVAWGMCNSMTVPSGVSMFNCSMAVNISIGSGQEGNKSDEGL